MLNNSVTLALNGDVSLGQYAKAIDQFNRLMGALSHDIAPDAIVEWLVDDLQRGSAVATIWGESKKAEAVEAVVRGYSAVGRSLASGASIPYSEKVAKAARGLVRLLDGTITSIRFETADDDATVDSPRAVRPYRLVGAYGAVEGRIQTLTSRNALRFVLYDALDDRAVSCYLQQGHEVMMRHAWDRRAIVEGWVSRDALTGRPVTVRRVESVTLIEDVPRGAYQEARGVVSVGASGLTAVAAIRRLRDA